MNQFLFCFLVLVLFQHPAKAQNSIGLERILKGDTTLPRMRANAYFNAIEARLDTTKIVYVGRLEAISNNRQFAIRDMFGALSLEAKRLGGNGYKFVRYYYDSTSGGLKLQFDIYLLPDSLVRLNHSLKPKSKVVVINGYYRRTLKIYEDTFAMAPKSYYSIPVDKQEVIKIKLKGSVVKQRFKGVLLAEKSRYFLTELAAPVTPYFAYGLVGGIAGGIAMSLMTEEKLHEVDENLAFILMKLYKRNEIR